MTIPMTKVARQARIADLLQRQPIRSQPELAKLLLESGVEVTQATLSRDLDELGALKLRAEDGSLVYALPGEGGDRIRRARVGTGESPAARLGRLAEELLVSAEASANLVIVRTPPGGRAVPRLRHRPRRLGVHPRHRGRRRHHPRHQPGPDGRGVGRRSAAQARRPTYSARSGGRSLAASDTHDERRTWRYQS
ncbi:hypothetical protein GCM10017559_67760 [Streptosporangium longisporum]|uniref:Arginine repressor n=1 Tax=Streptosporangium longisporum TaxID=46187 RepID=A0ABP6L2Y3_9ACTN